jgi:hypothetical protein
MLSHTEIETIQQFDDSPESFPYRRKGVNQKGYSKDTKRPTIEVLAEHILSKPIALFNDEMLKGNKIKDKFTNGHDEQALDEALSDSSKDGEKMMVRQWVKDLKVFPSLGKCFEYELNLVAGLKTNIDLLTYREGVIYLVEVKGSKNRKPKSEPDGLLRAVLEIATYQEMLKKHLGTFQEQVAVSSMAKRAFGEPIKLVIHDVRLAVLIPNYGPAFEAWQALGSTSEYPHLKELIRTYGVKVVVYDATTFDEITQSPLPKD